MTERLYFSKDIDVTDRAQFDITIHNVNTDLLKAMQKAKINTGFVRMVFTRPARYIATHVKVDNDVQLGDKSSTFTVNQFYEHMGVSNEDKAEGEVRRDN